MSHRVTTETEMKDRELVKAACKAQGVSFSDSAGNTIHFTGGKLQGASLDLKTGRISGDTDYGHNAKTLGALRQAYGEAKYRFECARQGIQIESREVDKAGNIVLICAMA